MNKTDIFFLKVVAAIVGGSLVVGGFYIGIKLIEAACLEALSQALAII
jgi:hypothetical protein